MEQRAICMERYYNGIDRSYIMKTFRGFCSVNLTVDPNPNYSDENPDLDLDIGSGFTGQIPGLEPDPDFGSCVYFVEIFSKTGSGFPWICSVNQDTILSVLHPDPVLVQDLVPKKKARRAGARRAAAAGRSIANDGVYRHLACASQGRAVATHSVAWTSKKKAKTEIKKGKKVKQKGRRMAATAARVCARWCSACIPDTLPKLINLVGELQCRPVLRGVEGTGEGAGQARSNE